MAQSFSSKGNSTFSESYKAAAVIELGAAVLVTGEYEVTQISGAGDVGVGVANVDPGEPSSTQSYQAGQAVSVMTGACKVRSGAAFAVGVELTVNASGKFIERTTPATEALWGIALQPATAVDEYVNAKISVSSNG